VLRFLRKERRPDFLHWSFEETGMKVYWGVLVVARMIAFLILFLRDHESKKSIERLSAATSQLCSHFAAKRPCPLRGRSGYRLASKAG